MCAAPVSAPDEHRFPCPNCGADLRFSPGTGQLTCDHCGHSEALTQGRQKRATIPETDFRAGIEAQLPEAEVEERRVSHCPNCGADVQFDPNINAMDCPFCATPVVADTATTRHIRPKGVAPFVVPEGQARKAMSDWLGSLWFAPSGLVAYARNGRKLEGIYLPFWTFDANTSSDYTGQRGTIYYTAEQVMVRDQNGQMHSETRQVQQIRWTAVSGHVKRFFDDVLVLASRSLPAQHTDALAPWDLTLLEPYQPEYLAGFRAETYGVSLDDGMVAARSYMDRMIERDVRFDIGGDRQNVASIDTDISDVTFKHILLPVWAAAYKFRGKSYRFVVNAQTGTVSGERPWSVAKILTAVILVGALVGIGLWVAQDPQAAQLLLQSWISRFTR